MPLSLAYATSLRHVTIAGAMLLLLVSCEKPSQPAAPAQVPEPKTVVLPTKPTPITFTSDDPRVASEVGLRTAGLDLSTIGKRGLLTFGPYIPLPPAEYEIVFNLVIHPGHAGVVHLDVVHQLGNQTLAAKDMDAATLSASVAGGTLTTLPFTVSEPVTDLEVRVVVTGESKMSISGYTIRPKP